MHNMFIIGAKMSNPTERFTKTVQNYINYRPSYPQEVIQLLINECGLKPEHIIADIGSGTGILTRLLLDCGNEVFAVEPNTAMRQAAEEDLKDRSNFHSCVGKAEQTNLPDHSVDFITAGTAFHWFDADKTKQEWQRIIRSPGWVVLIWNVRDLRAQVMQDYEALLIKYGTDYQASRAEAFDKTAVQSFFSPYKMHTASFQYVQQFDWAGFQGRLLSASYSLQLGDKRFDEMIGHLEQIFKKHESNGVIEFVYQTKLYYGQM